MQFFFSSLICAKTRLDNTETVYFLNQLFKMEFGHFESTNSTLEKFVFCKKRETNQRVFTLGNRPPLLTIYFVQIAGKKKGTEVGNSFKRVKECSN